MTKEEAMIRTLAKENDELEMEIGRLRQSLEKEPCEDAVSRQAVLDEKYLIELEDGQSFYCINPEDVEALPPVTPTRKGWIPYPERKPEEHKDVLIDVKEGEEHTFHVTHLVDVNYWVRLGRDVNVVAWMPLPEPYKGD